MLKYRYASSMWLNFIKCLNVLKVILEFFVVGMLGTEIYEPIIIYTVFVKIL